MGANGMNDDVMMIENSLSTEGVRRVHVMGSEKCHVTGDERQVAGIEIPAWAEVKVWVDELKLHHLEATWQPRGELVDYSMASHCEVDCPFCQGRGCIWRRVVSLWMLKKGESLREGMKGASEAFALATGRDPLYAWARRLPKGVEWGAEVAVGGEAFVNLYSADWMPERAVAVGRGNGGSHE